MSSEKTSQLSGQPRLETSRGKCYWVQAYYSVSGDRKRVSGKSQREAKKLAKEKIASEQEEMRPKPESLLLNRFAERFIADSRRGRDGRQPLVPATLIAYESYIRKWINPGIGLLFLHDINSAKVRDFRDHLIRSCGNRNTAKHALNLLKSILGYAVVLEIIDSNPANGVIIRMDWNQEQENNISRIPSEDEMAEIDELARSFYESTNTITSKSYRRYYPMYLILRTTGLRISECLGLQWDDFGSNHETVSIKRKLDRARRNQSLEERIGRPKTKNARRTVPVPPAVRTILAEWRLKCPTTDEAWVFPTRTGRPLDYNNVKDKFWKPLIQQAASARVSKGQSPIIDQGIHSLRHFFVSILVREGRIKEASMFAGHSSVAFTLDRYGHLIPNDKKTMDEMTEIISRNMNI